MSKAFCFLAFLMACVPVVEKGADVSVNVSVPAEVQEPVVEKEVVEEVEVSVPKTVPEVVEQAGLDDCVAFGCPPGTGVVADVVSDLFYECDCPRTRWIKPENVLCLESAEYAVERGYRKAESC